MLIVLDPLSIPVWKERLPVFSSHIYVVNNNDNSDSNINDWVKVFKNGPSKIRGRQSLKIGIDMVCLSRPQILPGPFFNSRDPIIISYGIAYRLTHFMPLFSFYTPLKTENLLLSDVSRKNRKSLAA